MGLIIPKGPDWSHCSSNMTIGAFGTSVTAGANDADGAAVTLLGALAHDVEYLTLGINGFASLSADSGTLLDILIDPAGGSSWSSLIDDLICGFTAVEGTTSTGVPCNYFFPIWIPAGASIGVMARTAHTSDLTATNGVSIFAYGGNANPASWWCGQRVATLGADPASSQGTDHTPGVSSSFSSWAGFGDLLSADAGAVQFGVQGADAGTTNNTYVVEFGVGETRIGPPRYVRTTTAETAFSSPSGPIFKSVPAGSQFQVRAATTLVSSEPLDVAAYAVH